MLALLRFAAAAIAVALFPSSPRAQPTASTFAVAVDRQATDAATAALGTFRALIRQQKNFREMGFESPDELDRATLGDPVAGYMVRLDELAAFKPGTDPAPLLHPSRQVMFPVLVDGKVRSSVTVSAGDKGWTPTGFGAPSKASLVTRTRDLTAKATQLAPTALPLVEVPGMKLVFIGHSTGGTVFLTPVLDYPAYGLKADVPVRADEVFAKLAPMTRAFRDVPG